LPPSPAASRRSRVIIEFPEKCFDGVGIAYCFVVEPCLDEFPVDRLA
jgi:hypothetical protein